MLKPHIEWNFVTLYHYQLLYNIYQYISILHFITVSDHIAYVDACLAFICVCTCIHVFTCFYCKLFDEQPWYRVLGFLVVGVVQTDAQIGNSVLVPSSSSSGILGLLPSTSPVWYHRWWSNLGEFQRHENTTGLSYGLPRFLMMRVSCLAMFISCTGGRLVVFADWRCLMETCTLQQPQLWPGTLWWNCFFPSPSLLRQLPENYSAFPDISGRLFLKIHSDGFAAPLQLVFLPFLTKFLMKGLVRWVLPVCYCMEYCPLEIT